VKRYIWFIVPALGLAAVVLGYLLFNLNETLVYYRTPAEVRQEVAADANARLQINVAPGLPAVRADREALGRAVWNLLDNAVKYSPHAPQVRLTGRAAGSSIEIAVEDEGLGIAPDEQARIFQKFARGSAAASTGAKGTGLGLSMVRHIVEAHGGTVRVESRPGGGSTFTIALPTAT